MVPTKWRSLLGELSKGLNIPQEDLTSIIDHYYKENRKLASTLSYIYINLRGLGVLSMKGWELGKRIRSIESNLSVNSDKNNRDKLQNDLAIYNEAKVKWEEVSKRKQEVKARKQQYRNNK